MTDCTFADHNGERTILISGDVVIRHVADLASQLRELVATELPCVLDLSEVLSLDAAGVQLLIAAAKEFRSAGKELRLIRHSPAVLSTFDLFGLVAFFGDPIRITKKERGEYSFRYGTRRNAAYPR